MTTQVTPVYHRLIPAQPRLNFLGIFPRWPVPEDIRSDTLPTEYHYEVSNIRPYRTTSGQIGYLPSVMHRAYVYESSDKKVIQDGSAPTVPRQMVTAEQSDRPSNLLMGWSVSQRRK